MLAAAIAAPDARCIALAQDVATRERRAQRRYPRYAAPEVLATEPGQVWSWDITKLRGSAPGIWYSLTQEQVGADHLSDPYGLR